MEKELRDYQEFLKKKLMMNFKESVKSAYRTYDHAVEYAKSLKYEHLRQRALESALKLKENSIDGYKKILDSGIKSLTEIYKKH